MGSFERKLKRNQLRAEFNNLTKQWAAAKMFQQQRLDKGETLQPTEEKLGTKPGFSAFIKRMKASKAMDMIQSQLKAQEKKEEEKKIDLEWKEE